MILRSVTKHVRDQNWFAVAIDFFIVVFGVYVGLQFQEWSDQKALDASEAQFLSEVREEIKYNAALNASLVESMGVLVASGKRAVRFLESDRACDDDCWRILVDLFTASQVFSPARSAVVYDEMQRLGFPRSTEVKAAINDFYTLNATASLGIDNNPKYRSSFRELLTIEVHEQLWSHCHSVKGPVELLIVDCPQSLPTERIKPILDRIRARPEVLDQLHYWIGMHSLWVPYFADILAAADHAIEVIDSVQNY